MAAFEGRNCGEQEGSGKPGEKQMLLQTFFFLMKKMCISDIFFFFDSECDVDAGKKYRLDD